jgi:hypothetical protein
MSSREEVEMMQRARSLSWPSITLGDYASTWAQNLWNFYERAVRRACTVTLPCPHCGHAIKFKAQADMHGDPHITIEKTE